jgi:stage II sporulation protein D
MRVRPLTLASALGCVVAIWMAFPAVSSARSLFLIEGRGWGHGVGLGQWGAEGYARHGWRYDRILAHYYAHTKLETYAPQDVRVLLAQGQEQVAVSSAAPFAVVGSRGERVTVPARALRFRGALKLRTLVPPLRVEPGAQPLTLDGAAYRGALLLTPANGRVDVVNVVSLDRYLRGVVSSEMPRGWHRAAYEAQAVAARTYALHSLNPGAAFDLYADTRDQVYGGVAAETAATNAAVGATAGRVLTYGGRVIAAYYSSSSGGRTAAVEDVLPRGPVPYLVSVRDPYDSVGPHHSWNVVERSDALSDEFGLPVADVRLDLNGSGRVSRVVLSGRKGSKTLGGRDFMKALGLQSTYFKVHVVSLSEPPPRVYFADRIWLHGFVRGIGGVVLQELQPAGGWRQVARVRARADGRFEAVVRPRFSTAYRLAVDRVPGPEISLRVARKIDVRTEGTLLAGKVLPAGPVQVERRSARGWQPVRGVEVGPSGSFRVKLPRAGSYRVAAAESRRFLASASRAVNVRR